MRSRRQDLCRPVVRPITGRRGGLGSLRQPGRALRVAWLLLVLILLVPAVHRHTGRSDAGALEEATEHTALVMLMPERLALVAPETHDGDAVCPWPAPAWARGEPAFAALSVDCPSALPLPQSRLFPLRV